MFKKGYKQTKEHRDRISKAHLGKKQPWSLGNKNGFKKGKHPWNYGIKDVFVGDKNPNWKGGTLYDRVFTRDEWTCQICGLVDKDVMEVDHKIPQRIRPDLKKAIENLWTLCANCHRRKTRKEDWAKIKEHRNQ